MVSSSSSFNKITTTGANTCFSFPHLHKPGSQMDTTSASSSSPSPSSSSVDSVTFYDFLDRMRNPASIDLVRSVKSFIVSFSFYTANPENDGKRVQEFFSMMEAAIKDHTLWAGATSQDIDSAMEGLEKYVMTKLFSRTFASTPEDVKIDQEISDKICLLQTFLRPEHLDIPAPLRNEASWLLAEKELQKINAFKAPREKLLCIMNFCRVINNLLLNASMSENIVLGGADDFLPVLIYVTIKANPPQLHSNLKFIQLYRRQTKLVSEAAYYFTNLVSAKTFIVDLNAKSLSIEEIKFEESMQAAKVANKAMRIEALSTSHERKASGEQRGPGPSRRMYHDETKTSDLYEIMRLEALHSSNDIKVLAEQIHPSPSGRIYGNETSTSGEYDYPYMEAKASELTVGDVEKLLSLYKDVVRKYKSLCHAVRHVSMTRAIPYKPHSGEKSVRLTQPAETSASVDCKRGN